MTSAPAAVRDLSSGAVVRRAYFGVEGKAFNDFFYEFRLNGGGSNGSGSGGAAGVSPAAKAIRWSTSRASPISAFPISNSTSASSSPPSCSKARFRPPSLPSWSVRRSTTSPPTLSAPATPAAASKCATRRTACFMAGDNLVLDAAFTGAKTGIELRSWSWRRRADADAGPRRRTAFWSDGVSNASIGASGGDVLSPGSNAGAYNTLNFQDRPEIRVDGTRLISPAASRPRRGYMYAFDAGANFENFFLGGEYAQFRRQTAAATRSAPALPATPDTTELLRLVRRRSWMLTGRNQEPTPRPRRNNEVGGFGAPKVAAALLAVGRLLGRMGTRGALQRHRSELAEHLRGGHRPTFQGGINGGDERIVALGVNWYLNHNVKLQLDDLITASTSISDQSTAPRHHATARTSTHWRPPAVHELIQRPGATVSTSRGNT